MRYNDRFKTLIFKDKLVHITVRDELEERLFDREQILLETINEQENKKGPLKTDLGLTLFETRKINEQNLREMKERMQEHINKRTQEFRGLKQEVKREMLRENHEQLVELKAEVNRTREIRNIIKNEQKSELDRNI